MDWRVYPSWPEHFQEGTSSLGSANSDVSPRSQMWVSAEEYQEDPDIIHKKLGF